MGNTPNNVAPNGEVGIAPTPAEDVVVETVSKAPKKQQKLKTLRSRLNHPVELAYGDDVLIVPPRGTIEHVIASNLGTTPNGIVLIDE